MENKTPVKLIDAISTQESLTEIKTLCRFYLFRFNVDESLSVSQLSIRVMTNRIRRKIKERFSAARY